MSEDVMVRRARTSDVRAIRELIDGYARQRILLAKETVTLYEDVQEFWVAEAPNAGAGAGRSGSAVVGCGALHVLWEDLAEVRTLAVAPEWRGRGVGDALLKALLAAATRVGVSRVFCLTFQVRFFARHGFEVIDGAPVPADVFSEMLRSYDEGVAEFLDLERVKPNTLGNTRMLLRLPSGR